LTVDAQEDQGLQLLCGAKVRNCQPSSREVGGCVGGRPAQVGSLPKPRTIVVITHRGGPEGPPRNVVAVGYIMPGIPPPMAPMAAAAAAGSTSSGLSVTSVSVVNRSAAIDAAF